jgi:integrase
MAKVFQPCKEDEKDRFYPCEKTRCGHKWTVRYREPGGRSGRQREKSFDLKRDADAFANKVENEKNAGLYLDPNRGAMTVQAYGREWLDRQRVTGETLHEYRAALENYLFPALGRKTLAGVSNGDIESLVTKMTRQGVSKQKREAAEGLAPATITFLLIPIKGMFAAAVKDKRISENPCAGVKPPKAKGLGVDRDEIPTAEEVHVLAETMPRNLRLAILLMAGAGLRASEALAVTEDSVRGDMLKIRQQVVTSYKKYGKWFRPLKHRIEGEYREIPLAPSLAMGIAAHISEFGTVVVEGQAGVVFYTRTRNPLTYSSFQHHWDRTVAEIKFGYTAHDLRHYFASTALAGGRPIHEVSRWMGHQSIQETVDTYGHLTKEAPEKMRVVMEAALWPESDGGSLRVAA